MLATAIIAFREFLEASLLIGLFIGIDRKLRLGKQKEIFSAAILGILVSLILPVIVFFFANEVKSTLNEKNTDLLEGYFLTFSGFFLAYVIFSLHSYMRYLQDRTIAKAKKKMEQEIFDISLFLTIVLFIVREGFEVAILIAATAVFSVFWTNVAGLLIGFTASSLVGFTTVFTFVKLPIRRVFRYTEYLILILGAAMVMNGVSELFEAYWNIHLDRYFPLPLQFLPHDSTVIGHALKNLFGVQQEFSLIQIGLMGAYIIGIYYFLLRKSFH